MWCPQQHCQARERVSQPVPSPTGSSGSWRFHDHLCEPWNGSERCSRHWLHSLRRPTDARSVGCRLGVCCVCVLPLLPGDLPIALVVSLCWLIYCYCRLWRQFLRRRPTIPSRRLDVPQLQRPPIRQSRCLPQVRHCQACSARTTAAGTSTGADTGFQPVLQRQPASERQCLVMRA